MSEKKDEFTVNIFDKRIDMHLIVFYQLMLVKAIASAHSGNRRSSE